MALRYALIVVQARNDDDDDDDDLFALSVVVSESDSSVPPAGVYANRVDDLPRVDVDSG